MQASGAPGVKDHADYVLREYHQEQPGDSARDCHLGLLLGLGVALGGFKLDGPKDEHQDGERTCNALGHYDEVVDEIAERLGGIRAGRKAWDGGKSDKEDRYNKDPERETLAVHLYLLVIYVIGIAII